MYKTKEIKTIVENCKTIEDVYHVRDILYNYISDFSEENISIIMLIIYDAEVKFKK